MKIKLILNKGDKPFEKTIDEPMTLEALAGEYKDKIRHRPMFATVNGLDTGLDEMVPDGATIEFVDASTQSGNLVYQHTLSMIFLKAVKNVLGNVTAMIHNPLNKGLYITIDTKEPLLDDQIDLIAGMMREYIRRDLPITRKSLPRQEAYDALKRFGYEDKALLLEQAADVETVRFHAIGDYGNFFYGIMAPSTGYVNVFELRRYGEGLLLRFPYTDDPEVLPEYRDDVKLYEAFRMVEEWDKLLHINFLGDLNKAIADGNTRGMILLSEALHEKRIAEIADEICESGKRIVLIAGPSSSGKTSFARRLCIQLAVNGLWPMYMGTDDYFVEREDTPLDANGQPDYENLNAMDVGLFNSNMNDLLAGKEVDMPSFNFITGHKEYGKRKMKMYDKTIMVIEGIHALNEAMTPEIDAKDKFKIYISPLTQLNVDVHNRISTTDARMLRRMVRDNQFRGHSAEETIREWPKVRAGEDKNVFPYNGEADVLFNSVTIYELALMKQYAQPLLEQVPQTSPCYGEAQRMIEFLSYFQPLNGEQYIPNNSIMREFIGGSVLLDD